MVLKAEPQIRFTAREQPVLPRVVPPPLQRVYLEQQVRADAPVDEATQRNKNDEEAMQAGLLGLMAAARFFPIATGAAATVLAGVGVRGGRVTVSSAIALWILPQPFGAVDPSYYDLRGNYLREYTRRLGLPPIQSELLHAYEDNPQTDDKYRQVVIEKGARAYERYTVLLETHELEEDYRLFLRARVGLAATPRGFDPEPLVASAAEALSRRRGGVAKVQTIFNEVSAELAGVHTRRLLLEGVVLAPYAIRRGAWSAAEAEVDSQTGPTTLATHAATQTPRFLRGMQSGRRDP